MLTLAAALAPGLPTDQRTALTALVVAVAAMIHAIANTTAEGAVAVHRWTLRAASAVIVLVALYAAIRLWS